MKNVQNPTKKMYAIQKHKRSSLKSKEFEEHRKSSLENPTGILPEVLVDPDNSRKKTEPKR